MQVAEESMVRAAEMAWSGNQFADDAGLRVQFTSEPVQDMDATAREGRPIFVDQDFISIQVPGQRDVVKAYVWTDEKHPASHVRRFPVQWAAYKAGKGDVLVGTPLRDWPGVTRSQAEELSYFGARTVEELAAISDANLQRLQHGLALRQKARDFIEAAKKAAPVAQLQEQLRKQDAEMAELRASIAEMAKAMADGKAEKSKK